MRREPVWAGRSGRQTHNASPPPQPLRRTPGTITSSGASAPFSTPGRHAKGDATRDYREPRPWSPRARASGPTSPTTATATPVGGNGIPSRTTTWGSEPFVQGVTPSTQHHDAAQSQNHRRSHHPGKLVRQQPQRIPPTTHQDTQHQRDNPGVPYPQGLPHHTPMKISKGGDWEEARRQFVRPSSRRGSVLAQHPTAGTGFRTFRPLRQESTAAHDNDHRP